jgi:ribosome-binding protein aMBF1 (putative translation factor)
MEKSLALNFQEQDTFIKQYERFEEDPSLEEAEKLEEKVKTIISQLPLNHPKNKEFNNYKITLEYHIKNYKKG